jgi:hypothetical protein
VQGESTVLDFSFSKAIVQEIFEIKKSIPDIIFQS